MKCRWGLSAVLVASASASPVGKVVEMLKTLGVRVADDLKTTKKDVEEYGVYCHEEQRDRGFSIKSSKDTIDQNEALIANAESKISNQTAALQEAAAAQAQAEGDLKKATENHEEAMADHAAAEKELAETADMISRAISVLKREMVSFLQGGNRDKVMDDELKKVLPALRAIIASGRLPTDASQRNLSAFLAQEPEEADTAAAGPPQARKVVYESKTSGIVDALVELREKAEEQQQARAKERMQDQHEFALEQQSLRAIIKNSGEQVDNAKKIRANAEAEKAECEGELAEAQASLKADEDFVASLKNSCAKTEEAWAARSKSGKDEIKAIEKATEILLGGVKVNFLQTQTRLFKARSKEVSLRDQLSDMLHKLGKKYSNFSLMELANAAEKDPFVKIRNMIGNMIAKLQKEEEEEATKDKFCKEEKVKSENSRDARQEKVDEYQARLDKAEAKLNTLASDVETLGDELTELQKTTAEATQIRREQNVEFVKSEKEYSQSVDAVSQAISVLREFYNDSAASFLEQPAAPIVNKTALSDAGNGIIGILETALDDFSRTLMEKKDTEADQASTFEDLMQKNQVVKATKEAELKGKEQMIKQLHSSLNSHKEDLKTSSDELDAVLDYIEKLKPQCTIKQETYEERQEKRDNEIAGLKDALNILEGEGA